MKTLFVIFVEKVRERRKGKPSNIMKKTNILSHSFMFFFLFGLGARVFYLDKKRRKKRMEVIKVTSSLASMRAMLDYIEGNIDDGYICEAFIKAEKAFNKNFYAKSRKAPICSFCKKKGHSKSTCPTFPLEKEEEEEEEDDSEDDEEEEEEEEEEQPPKKKSKKNPKKL